MAYLEGKHIPLFIAALLVLLVGLVYTLLLLFWQCFLHCSNRKVTKWVTHPKLNSFMDAYHAPYSSQYRFWTGLLLLVRVLLYLVSAYVDENPSFILLLIIVVVGSLLLISNLSHKVYKQWPLSTLESLCIFNVIIFAAATLYVRETNEDQTALAYTSASVSFVTFFIILVYHTYMFVLIRLSCLHSLPRKFKYKSIVNTELNNSETEMTNSLLGNQPSVARLRESLIAHCQVDYCKSPKTPSSKQVITRTVIEGVP